MIHIDIKALEAAVTNSFRKLFIDLISVIHTQIYICYRHFTFIYHRFRYAYTRNKEVHTLSVYRKTMRYWLTFQLAR